MRRWIVFLLSLFAVASAERLDHKYCIFYGDPNAPVEVVEYFSFSCPHCIVLFDRDFQTIRCRYIENGRVRWIFHPVPNDMQTVQAIACLSVLSDQDKRVVLEAVLPSIDVSAPEINTRIMQRAMQHFGSEAPPMDDLSALAAQPYFKDAYAYIQQPEAIRDVPTVEINGRVYEDVPSLEFLRKHIGVAP